MRMHLADRERRVFMEGLLVRIKRVFNNNAVIAYRDDGEVVVFGRGVGYQKQHGDAIDPVRIEKIFTTTSKQNAYLEDMLREIPLAHIELTTHAVKQAESDLDMNFPSSTFIAVLDHITFALRRADKGQFITNPLLWEIRSTYGAEYKAAIKTLDIIEEETGVRLPADEAGTIAIHYFNAQDPSRHLKESYQVVELIREITLAIQEDFDIEFDKEGADFNRLMTHLRFFANSLMSAEYRASALADSFLFDQMRQQYPRVYECVLRIRSLVERKLKREVGTEELLYLMIHIQRIVQKPNPILKRSNA